MRSRHEVRASLQLACHYSLPDHDHLLQYWQELCEVVGLEEEVEDAVEDEVGRRVHVVPVGDRLPEDDGVVVHLPA